MSEERRGELKLFTGVRADRKRGASGPKAPVVPLQAPTSRTVLDIAREAKRANTKGQTNE